MELRDAYVWSYGYRYERATTLEPSLGPGDHGDADACRRSPARSRARRATTCSTRHAARSCRRRSPIRRAWLGSDRPYLKYYGQYFHYFPLRRRSASRSPTRSCGRGSCSPPACASAWRSGIGGDVPTSERFYAGGSTHAARLRAERGRPDRREQRAGRRQRAARAQQRAARAAGRHRRRRGVRSTSATSFRRVSDFSFTDLRESAGVGLRVRTPWFLIRGDYGRGARSAAPASVAAASISASARRFSAAVHSRTWESTILEPQLHPF